LRTISFVSILSLLVAVGCQSSVNPEVKDTGWVTVTRSSYMYHKTIRFPDGREVEFYHCAAVGALEEDNSIVRIHYEGDGSSMHDCAEHVTVEQKPGTRNSEGKLIATGTKQVKGNDWDKETLFLTSTNSDCGKVYYLSNNWIAAAYHDYSRNHYFNTRAEAVKFITENWCKP
jgi:hypothetical protein